MPVSCVAFLLLIDSVWWAVLTASNPYAEKILYSILSTTRSRSILEEVN
jgi:hypothetical protein